VEFIEHLPFYGLAVLCGDDAHVRAIVPLITKPVLTYGVEDGVDLRATNVRAAGATMKFIVVSRDGNAPLEVSLNLAGHHNVLNALSAIAIGREAGVDDASIARALATFGGVGRRFQRFGEIAIEGGGTFTLIDDYGHHPVEMDAVLKAARGAFPDRRLLLAFQPHRYTRTRDLFEDFVRVISTADEVVLADVYPAGEAPIVAADGRALARALRVSGKLEPAFVESAAEMPDAVRSRVKDQDVVICMGAGSVGGVAPALAGLGGGE
jgi:UDP-N-acetylmuramate--alanine ligase